MASVLQSASRESLATAARRALDAHIDGSVTGGPLAAAGRGPVRRARPARPRVRRCAGRSPTRPRRPVPEVRARRPAAQRQDRPNRARRRCPTWSPSRWSRHRPTCRGRWRRWPPALRAFGVAEKDGSLDRVEDELFRFGRILDREPQLAQAALADAAHARPTSASGCCTRCSGEQGRHRSPPRCSSRRSARPAQPQPRPWRPRSSRSWPRPAATATSPTSARPSASRPSRSSGSPTR